LDPKLSQKKFGGKTPQYKMFIYKLPLSLTIVVSRNMAKIWSVGWSLFQSMVLNYAS